jgi:hypothetical protein
MARICPAVAVAIVLSACGGTLASVRLEPEQPTTVHVGQVVAVPLSSESHYAISSAGRSVILTKQAEQHKTTLHFYRAVEVGSQTLVATPRDPGPEGCISCVTVRYFIKVVE